MPSDLVVVPNGWTSGDVVAVVIETGIVIGKTMDLVFCVVEIVSVNVNVWAARE